MDKEYLSLMAELGEAPVPASGGGLNTNNPPGGPRGTGPTTNQPPPVSTPGLFCSFLYLDDWGWISVDLSSKMTVNLHEEDCATPILHVVWFGNSFYDQSSTSLVPHYPLISCLEPSSLDELRTFR